MPRVWTENEMVDGHLIEVLLRVRNDLGSLLQSCTRIGCASDHERGSGSKAGELRHSRTYRVPDAQIESAQTHHILIATRPPLVRANDDAQSLSLTLVLHDVPLDFGESS